MSAASSVTSEQRARVDRSMWAVAGAVFAVAFALGVAQLYSAHPAEDAFILFKYAANVAHGDGAVYYVGGPPTEGATDFLWLVLLAATVAARVDVALAAIFWNALGAAVAAAVVDREIARAVPTSRWRLLLLVIPLSIPFVAGAPAAYLGFSSLAYQALVLVLFVATVDERARYSSVVPWLGLVLTLFRPDGAFLAIAFVAAAARSAHRAGRFASFVTSMLAAASVGVVYFVARAVYFGSWLPLPLYVKSHGVIRGSLADRIVEHVPWLKGIGMQLMWLKSPLGPTTMAAASAILLVLPPAYGAATRLTLRRAPVAAVASLVFLGALSLAFQVQNVFFRYQAPVTLLLLYVLGSLAAARIAETRSTALRMLICLVVVGALAPTVAGGARSIADAARGRSYIDVLPARLAEILAPGRTIALTDAGRLAYWNHTRTIDVAGLNYAPTALHPPSVEMLREIDPDVLLIHPGAAVVGETFPPDVGAPPFWEIDPARIERSVSPLQRSIYDRGLDEYTSSSNTATVAALVMLRYLVERGDEYAIEAVRYQGGYRHVLAFRRSLPEASAIRVALEQATSGRGYAPYAALKGFPFARRFDAVVDGSEQ